MYEDNQKQEFDPFEGLSEEDIQELIEVFYEDLSEKLSELSSMFLSLEEDPDNIELIDNVLQIYHSIKGTGGTFNYPIISDSAHIIESFFIQVKNREKILNADVTDKLLGINEVFTDLIEEIKDRKSTKSLEKRLLELSRILESAKAPKAPKAKKPEKALYPDNREKIGEETKKKSEDYIKIKSSRINKLISLSSELKVHKRFEMKHLKRINAIRHLIEKTKSEFLGKLDHKNSENISENIDILTDIIDKEIKDISKEYLERLEKKSFIVEELQSEILKSRMLPIDYLYKFLKRTSRDLLKESDKKVRLKFSGAQTELDKAIMEDLKDPLVHIIRNAIDHGIEDPEIRDEKGKKAEAEIVLNALPSGDQIIITVVDDGKGIDINAIKRIVKDKNLADIEDIDNKKKDEIIDYIFHPGFSTKKDVSKISGRGIGMDVVRTNIKNLSGDIRVETEKNKGTKLIINIPFTLAAFDALLFKLGSFYFYLQSSMIDKIIRVSEEAEKPDEKFESLEINGEIVKYSYLGDLLNLEKEKRVISDTKIIVIETGKEKIALEVDDIIENHEIVVKPKPRLISNYNIVSGFSLLADGNFAYVLDPYELITNFTEKIQLTDKSVSWHLDEVNEKFKSDFVKNIEESLYNIKKTEKMVVMKFQYSNKIYGISVQDISMVCEYSEKNEKKCETLFDYMMFIENSEVFIKTIKEFDLNEVVRKKSRLNFGIFLNISDMKCIMIPDRLLDLDVISVQNVNLLKKSGKWESLIPDVLEF
ncbi:chemotaxis protein CheA [candidate division KSB1 bacterium]